MESAYLFSPTPENVKALREKLQLSQEEFAARLGVSFSTVNRWENGHVAPKKLALFRLEKLAQEASGNVPSDQGDGISGRLKDFLVVGVRDRLLFLDPGETARPFETARIVQLPNDLGPLRSISVAKLHGRDVLLAGMRDGVLVLPPQRNPAITRFSFGMYRGRGMGTNAACIAHGCLYATHSEHGLWRWPIDEPTSPERLFKDQLASAKTVRGIAPMRSDVLMFCADAKLYRFEKGSQAPEPFFETGEAARLVGAVVHDHTVYVASSEGRVFAWDLIFQRTNPLHSFESAHLYSANLSQCLGNPVLVLGMKKPFVTVVALGEEEERTLYRCGSSDVRVAVATDQHVIACDHGQSSLLVWEAERPEMPVSTLDIERKLSHQIQDLATIRLPENW